MSCWLWTEQRAEDGWKPQPGIKSIFADAQGPAESYQDTSTRVLSKSLTQVSVIKVRTWSQRVAGEGCALAQKRRQGRQPRPQREARWGDFHTRIVMDKVGFSASESSKHVLSPSAAVWQLLVPPVYSHLAIAWGHRHFPDPSPLGICQLPKETSSQWKITDFEDLSSLTGDWTNIRCMGSTESYLFTSSATWEAYISLQIITKYWVYFLVLHSKS